MKVRKYAADQCDVSTWFERDRQHVHLFCGDENTTVLEWWDEEVSEAVEDGFLDPRVASESRAVGMVLAVARIYELHGKPIAPDLNAKEAA